MKVLSRGVLVSHWPGAFTRQYLALENMVSLFILVFASIALGRFAVSQWRTIWITAANQPISDSLQVTAGIDGAAIGAQDFGSLLDLCDNLSPGLKKKTPWLKEVSLYYGAVAKLEQAFKLKLPSVSTWASQEMKNCSRYVAVVLDQNLAMNLDRRLAARIN
ncbi:MAG: hypothetical protein WBB89_11420 [Candidatus Acidiferrum sp.]